MGPKQAWRFSKEVFQEWNEDKVARLAAALAYFTLFSLAPLLIIVIAVVGFIFGEEAARGEIVGQIQGLVGADAAGVIQGAIDNAYRPDENVGVIASLIGFGLVLFGATNFFAQLQESLNTVWNVEPESGGASDFIRKRLLSFGMVLGIGVLVILLLFASTLINAFAELLADTFPDFDWLFQLLSFLVPFAVLTLLFAMIYKFLPDAHIAWGDVWIGSIITALMFAVGQFLLGFYLGTASFESTYGAAGSIVALLVWIFYSAQILLIGAEITQVYARRYGSQIHPQEGAVSTDEAVAAQGPSRNTTLDNRDDGMGRNDRRRMRRSGDRPSILRLGKPSRKSRRRF